jgi:hypothetical protein
MSLHQIKHEKKIKKKHLLLFIKASQDYCRTFVLKLSMIFFKNEQLPFKKKTILLILKF